MNCFHCYFFGRLCHYEMSLPKKVRKVGGLRVALEKARQQGLLSYGLEGSESERAVSLGAHSHSKVI